MLIPRHRWLWLGRRAAILVKPARIVPGEGHRFHHRVDAGVHGKVQLFRYNITVRGALR